MKKLIFLLLIVISTQSFSQEWFGFGYKTMNSSTLPTDWTQEYVAGDGTAAWYGYGGLYTPYEGSGNWYFNVWDAVGNHIGDEAMIITEAFSNNGIDNSFVGFWHQQVDFGGDNNELEVYYRTSATASWILLEAFPDAIEDWTEEQLFFPEQSTTMQVGFKGILTGGDNTQGVALDYIFLQYYTSLCFTPSNFEVGTVTSTTASVSWEEIGSSTTWNIEYGAYDYTQGTGTAINGINTTPEYEITGLTANTHYDVYVQADCGGGDFSDWAGPISFYTNCNTVTSFPYLETFNNEDIDGDDWNDPLHVNCWTENKGQIANPTIFTGADSDWSPREFGNEQDYNPDNANSLSSRLFGNTNAWLFSPIIDLGTANNKQLEFDIALANSSNNAISLVNQDTIAVVISTNGGATWNKSDILLHWDAATNASEITPAGIHQVIDLSTYTGEVQVAFYQNGASFGYIYIDNVEIDEISTSVLELLEPNVQNQASIYPNPATNQLNIKNIDSSINTIEILDVTGKTVLLRNIKSLNTSSINISELNKGIYFVKIGTEVQKFIKE